MKLEVEENPGGAGVSQAIQDIQAIRKREPVSNFEGSDVWREAFYDTDRLVHIMRVQSTDNFSDYHLFFPRIDDTFIVHRGDSPL
jgi:hypothetical protein